MTRKLVACWKGYKSKGMREWEWPQGQCTGLGSKFAPTWPLRCCRADENKDAAEKALQPRGTPAERQQARRSHWTLSMHLHPPKSETLKKKVPHLHIFFCSKQEGKLHGLPGGTEAADLAQPPWSSSAAPRCKNSWCGRSAVLETDESESESSEWPRRSLVKGFPPGPKGSTLPQQLESARTFCFTPQSLCGL